MSKAEQMPEQARQQLTATNNELKAKLAFANNSDRLQRASKAGTLPYFVRDNYKVGKDGTLTPTFASKEPTPYKGAFKGLPKEQGVIPKQALQLEWDTAQLDDWGIDMPDFTDEEDEDAIAEEDDYEMPEEIEEVETDIVRGDLIILEGRGLTHRLKEHIDTVLCREKRISTWIFRNIQVENFYFPRGEEKILRRNQMKLRRK